MAGDHKHIVTIQLYFHALNMNDQKKLRASFTDDIAHYYLQAEPKPTIGAENLIRFQAKLASLYDPEWHIDHFMEQGDEIVVEWTCFWSPMGSDKRLTTRGAEWYVMRDGRIAEIRPYYNWLMNADSELAGFPYAERGYAVASGARRGDAATLQRQARPS